MGAIIIVADRIHNVKKKDVKITEKKVNLMETVAAEPQRS